MLKTQLLNIIIFIVKNYNKWIEEITGKLDRKKAFIWFSRHAAKDKNLSVADVDRVNQTVKYGKPCLQRSSKQRKRICFRNYFKECNKTYFVVVVYLNNSIKVITAYNKKGKW